MKKSSVAIDNDEQWNKECGDEDDPVVLKSLLINTQKSIYFNNYQMVA